MLEMKRIENPGFQGGIVPMQYRDGLILDQVSPALRLDLQLRVVARPVGSQDITQVPRPSEIPSRDAIRLRIASPSRSACVRTCRTATAWRIVAVKLAPRGTFFLPRYNGLVNNDLDFNNRLSIIQSRGTRLPRWVPLRQRRRQSVAALALALFSFTSGRHYANID
jgi:hypothetical protein